MQREGRNEPQSFFRDGLLLVNKSKGPTSFDIVHKIKKILSVSKAGHFGTLDPMAEGLMLVALGQATRFFDFYAKMDKVYRGTIRLGFETDTYDTEGRRTSELISDLPDKESIKREMDKFIGSQDQIPPPYSAKKYKGKPLYDWARKKKDYELRPSRIVLHEFELMKYRPPFVDFLASCSSGTYIRSLAHDLGRNLNCGAHLFSLIRQKVGPFQLKDSHTLEEIAGENRPGEAFPFFIPLRELLPDYPKLVLNDRGILLAANGNTISTEHLSSDFKLDESTSQKKSFRLFDTKGNLVAVARKIPAKPALHPFLVVDSKETSR
jgi:tRNA pseudouridine55 synthase